MPGPTYTNVPYVKPAYERGDENISQMILQRNEGIARGHLQQAQIQANLWSDLASIISRTLGQYVQAKEEEPLRRYQAARAESEMEELARGKELNRLQRAFAGLPPEDIAKGLLQAGYPQEAQHWQNYVQKQREEATKKQEQEHNIALEKIGKAMDYVTMYVDRPGMAPEQQNEAWRMLRPEIAELLGPYGKSLPENYDPKSVSQWMQLGQKMTDRIQIRAGLLRDYREQGQDQRARATWFMENMPRLASTINMDAPDKGAAEYQQVVQAATMLGLPQEVKDRLPRVWTGPETLEQLKTMAQEVPAAQRVSPGSYEQFFSNHPLAKGKAYTDVPASDILKIASEWETMQANARQAGGDIVDLEGPSLDLVAIQFAKTGTVPSLGWGAAAAHLKAKVIKRAAELFPGLDIASNIADFSADKTSLVNLTKMQGNLGAYEQTAVKNLQVLQEQLKKIVDTKIPILNYPVRMAVERLGIEAPKYGISAAEQAAFNTALQTVRNEFARILVGGPNLTGVLSNEARREVEDFMKGDATIAQLSRVADILVRDATNRRTALDAEVNAVRSRIAAPPATTAPVTPAVTPPPPAAGPGPGDVKVPPEVLAEFKNRPNWRVVMNDGSVWISDAQGMVRMVTPPRKK